MLWQKFNYNESRHDKNKTLSVEEYLNKIRPYLKDITNYLKKYHTWKIQLTIPINFMSPKGKKEERVMHSRNENTERVINDKEHEVIE